MNFLLWNVLLAIAWTALSEHFTALNFLAGLVVGYGILFLLRPFGGASYHARVRHLISFVFYFLWEIILANLRVAYTLARPKRYLRPGVIAIPLAAKTGGEITILANCITLTPGTLSLDVSTDRQTLYIHALTIWDARALQDEIKNHLERRILEVMR